MPRLNPIIPNIVWEWKYINNFFITFIKISEPTVTPIIIGKITFIFTIETALRYVLYTPKIIKITVLLTPGYNNSKAHKKTA